LEDSTQGEQNPSAWRLICTADATGVRMVSRRRVQMTTPPSDAIGSTGERTGFWIEVRDARERVQYQRVIASPVEDDLEVPGDPEEGTLTHQPVEQPRTFALLVPELEHSDHVALLRATQAPGNTARALRTEVARLPLRAAASDRDDPRRDR